MALSSSGQGPWLLKSVTKVRISLESPKKGNMKINLENGWHVLPEPTDCDGYYRDRTVWLVAYIDKGEIIGLNACYKDVYTKDQSLESSHQRYPKLDNFPNPFLTDMRNRVDLDKMFMEMAPERTYPDLDDSPIYELF